VAKQAASVAVLTGNRFGLGVGLSPWPEDFEITGTEWKTRGKRMDEMIEIIQGLTAPGEAPPATPGESRPPAHTVGRYFAYRGTYYEVPSIKISPTPSQPIPILIGGHAEPALRRAARLADGWMHAGGDAGELDHCLSRLAELRKEQGREGDPFEIHVISLDAYTPDGLRRLEDQGVTDVIVGFRNSYEADTQPLQQKLDALRGYAENVIQKVR
jgi:alkanesulfonate monooxygenase SsuD/methylene tetrahydromethanopterin reductase-like flavin-dependent oxidoreductase (luciferase family)